MHEVLQTVTTGNSVFTSALTLTAPIEENDNEKLALGTGSGSETINHEAQR